MEPADYWNDEFVPGTELLVRRDTNGAPAEVVQVPQPTPSPNDPLNWSVARKYWHGFLVCGVTGLTAATTNNAGSAESGYNEEYNVSWGAFDTATGVLFIGIGYFTWILSPTSFLYGRRIGYIVCLLVGLAGNIWYACTTNTNDAIWSQLFVGASESIAEAQVQLSLADVFFQHQMGAALAMYILATSVGTYAGPLIGGYVADNLGAHWVGWVSAITTGFFAVLCYFTLEETMFDRALYNTTYYDQHGKGSLHSTNSNRTVSDTKEKAISGSEAMEISQSTNADVSSEPAIGMNGANVPQEKPKTYWQRIALITLADNIRGTGFKQFIKRFLLTARVFAFPPVLYAGLMWGAQDAWLSFYIDTEADWWDEEPFNYGDVAVGIMNVPTLIGAVIGCMYGGLLSDWFVHWMANRKGGVSEAETRLYMMLPLAIISPLGLLLFGAGTQYAWNWPGPYIGLGLIGVGWGVCGDLSMSYLCDAYPGMVLEGMVGVSVINNSIGMVFSFVTEDWLNASGVFNTYIAIAVLDFAFIMTTIPMIYYGKRCRRWTKGMYLRFIEQRDGL